MQLISNIDTHISLSQSRSEGHMSSNHPLFIIPARRLIVYPDFSPSVMMMGVVISTGMPVIWDPFGTSCSVEVGPLIPAAYWLLSYAKFQLSSFAEKYPCSSVNLSNRIRGRSLRQIM